MRLDAEVSLTSWYKLANTQAHFKRAPPSLHEQAVEESDFPSEPHKVPGRQKPPGASRMHDGDC